MDSIVGEDELDYNFDSSYYNDDFIHGDYSYNDNITFDNNMHDYDSFFDSSVFGVWILGFILIVIIISLIFEIFKIICNWKVFVKAGKEGWKSIIPIYKTWVLCEIVGLEGWYSLLQLIPIIGGIIALVLHIILCIRLSRCFGKSDAYTVGLIFLNLIFIAIIAFDKSEFKSYSNEKQIAN